MKRNVVSVCNRMKFKKIQVISCVVSFLVGLGVIGVVQGWSGTDSWLAQLSGIVFILGGVGQFVFVLEAAKQAKRLRGFEQREREVGLEAVLPERVKRKLADGKRITAIKELRVDTGLSLKDAVAVIDRAIDNHIDAPNGASANRLS